MLFRSYPDPGARSCTGDYAIFVGRFTSEKGLPTLLNAWKRIDTSVPLVIVGDGPLRESLEAQAAQMNNSRVIFRGHLSREATLAAVKSAKILLCASECYEQGPATVLEAFACGVPLIAPSLGPIDEVVDDGRTGLLFHAGDSAHLAEKIEWAFSHDEQLQSMGKNARAKFEANFSANKNYTRLMEIYERVISGRGYAINPCGSLDDAYHAPRGIASV